MLTKDLVRIGINKGVARPRYLDPDKQPLIERAERLIALFAQHEGASRGELEVALKAETGAGRDFRTWRGLAKLLMDKTDVDVASVHEPRRVRELVFELATARHPVSESARVEVLAQAAAQLECTPEAIESALYADLAANQRVVKAPSYTALELVNRYNLALAQAAVMRAKKLEITLKQPSTKRLRQLLRYLKFHRLMFTAQKDGADWRFQVDGPVSILKHSSRYGLQLANFLPALLLCEDWALSADYQAKKGSRRATFELTPDHGIVTHYRDTGTWVAAEEQALMKRLAELAAPWHVSDEAELVDLDGRGVLVPDLSIRNPETGATAYIEVIWSWRKASLQSRVRLLAKHGPKNLILAICGASEAPPELKAANVHTFKGVPNARTLLKLARAACS